MHLVTRNRNVHRFVLGMIIATALLIQIPNWCISIPAVSKETAVSAVWSPRDSIETRIQQVAFLLQESTISGLYIFYAYRLIKPNSHIRERRVVWDLIFVSGFVIFLDVVVIILAFTNVHVIKEPLQNFSYALKLQLEFFVLNQLMAVSGASFASSGGRGGHRSRYHVPKTASDACKAPVIVKSSGSGETELSQNSAQRLPSNDVNNSPIGQGRRAPDGPWGSTSTARTAVAPPAAAHLSDQDGSTTSSPSGIRPAVSRRALSPAGKTEEELIIPHMIKTGHVSALERGVLEGRPEAQRHHNAASPRTASHSSSRVDRTLPPSPPLVKGHQPAGSWLDLEGRLTDVERKLNALGSKDTDGYKKIKLSSWNGCNKHRERVKGRVRSGQCGRGTGEGAGKHRAERQSLD